MATKEITMTKMPVSAPVVRLVRGDNDSTLLRMSVDRFDGGIDLAELTWLVNAVNADGEFDAFSVQNVSIGEDCVSVDWLIGGTATRAEGETRFELEGVRGDDDVVWQSGSRVLMIYPDVSGFPQDVEEEVVSEISRLIVQVRNDLPEVYAARDAANEVADHPPVIGENGNWWLWDAEHDAYVDSGKSAGGGEGAGGVTREELEAMLAEIQAGNTLLNASRNLLNPATCTRGSVVEKSGLVAMANYACSDYIAVDGSKTYSFRGKYGGGVQIVLYDENKNYIWQMYDGQTTSGSYAKGYLVLDLSASYPNTRYVRVNMAAPAIGTLYMFVEGSDYPSEYIAYAEAGFKNDAIRQVILRMIGENQSVKLGEEELVANVPQQSIAIGDRAGGQGNGGIAIGNGALQTLEKSDGDNGRFNIAIGHQALRNATTADHSTAVGYQALRNCTTGDFNTAVGEDAAMSIVSGNRNVAVGCRAMQSQTIGDDNVAIGALARYFNDENKPTGSRNTVVGARAGDAGGAGADCVHVGYGAKNTQAGLNNTIVIGSDARATKANQTVIGNNSTSETLVRGALVVWGTDGVKRRIVFQADSTCTWEIVD